MKIINLAQGSKEWHEHRTKHFNASDAPAMLGISPYKSRSQLLKERATGIAQDVDDATQRRFNDGHRFEALARPLAEQIIGEELSPQTGVEGKYSASFDGITFGGDVIFEHKTLNDDIRAGLGDNGNAGGLPEHYRVQMEHQLMVSGSSKCLFMASKWDGDTLVEKMQGWYVRDLVLRGRIISGWEQFEKDLAAYSPAAEAEKVTATAIMSLPSLSVQIRGEVTNSNLPAFVSEADKFLAGIKTELKTDQDFADAESNVKACKSAEEGIESAKKAITAQATSIDEVMRTMDLYKEKLSTVRLKLDKLVKSEKESRKLAIVTKASNEFSEHILNLESEIKPIGLNRANVSGLKATFSDAIKGLKKLSAMQEAVDTALRNAKFAADQEAKDIRTKLAWCKEHAAGMSALFPDLQALMAKPMDDFTLTITSRIDKHKADEAAKMEAVRIQAEARAKLDAEAKSKETVKESLTVQSETIEPSPRTTSDKPTQKADWPFPIKDVTNKLPNDDEVINAIADKFGLTFGEACDLILSISERMKVSA